MLPDVRNIKDIKTRRMIKQERIKADTLDLFGEEPPAELLKPYVIAPEDQARVDELQKKYTNRERNIRRCWNRVQLYMPELMQGPSHDVLELSAAHGGMLEVLRHYGHNVMGSDYANMVSKRNGEEMRQFRKLNDKTFVRQEDDFGLPIDNADWPYRPICEAIDLPMTIFDAGKTPYPFDDKSYDYTMCFHAIEHYCHPDDWMDLVDEFCRITRKTVFIMLNRLVPEFRAKEDYNEAFTTFRRNMRDYNKNGFRCQATFVHWDSALGFKLMDTGD